MKKLLFVLLASLCVGAVAEPGEWQYNRRRLDAGPGTEPLFIPEPSAGAFFVYDRTNRTPVYKLFGTGIDCSGTYCNVTGGTGATGPAGPQGIQGVPGNNGTNGTNANTTAIVGTVTKSSVFRTYKNATVASGVAVFHLTDDGTATGNPLYTEVFTDSVSVIVNDATASYQMGWVFSNSNKTLTVTTNRLGTANLLSGVLGQVQANGVVVRLVIEGK